jgi:hypothetical protein
MRCPYVPSTVSHKAVSRSGGKSLIVVGGHRERSPGIRPLEGMGKMGVPGFAAAMNEVAQVLDGADAGPA